MQTNGVQIENTPNIIVITDSDANQITVTQPITSVIEVGAVGPQGPKGLPGDNIFTLVSASTYATTSSLIVTGSLTVSGSSTFTNIGPAIFSGSVTSTQGFTGSLFGTSSYAITASYALNGGSGGGGFYIATGSVSASVNLGTGSFTITSGSSNFLFISSSGNIGIGTTTPSRLLHVNEGGTRLYQTFKPGVPTLYVYHGRVEFDSTVRFENGSGDNLYFGGAGLFVTGNTTIGNGNTSLSARLAVKGSGTTSATTSFLVQNSNGLGNFQILDDSSVQVINEGKFSVNRYGNTLLTTGQAVSTLATYNSYITIDSNFITLYRSSTNYWNLRSTYTETYAPLITFTTFKAIDSSAQLEISSTSKGFLPPRNNTTSNISSPAQGLQTYITASATEGIYYYNSGSYQAWTRVLNDSGSQAITGSLTVVGTANLGGATFSNGGASFANNVNLGALTEGGAGNSWINFSGTRVHIGQNGSSAGLNVISATQYVGIGKTTPNTTLDVLGDVTVTGSLNLTSALTASNATITGNVTVLGTASINTLIVNQTQLSTGSNQLGDAADDFQTLYGTVRIPTGSLTVTGSTRFYSEQNSAFLAIVSGSRSSSDIAFNFRKIGEPLVGSRHTMIVEGTGGQDTNLYFGVNNVGSNPGATFAVKGNGSVNINMPNPTGNYGGLAVGGWISSYPSLLVRGIGATSSTTSLRVENANASASLSVTDDGIVTFHRGTYMNAASSNFFHTIDTGDANYGGIVLKNNTQDYAGYITTGRSGNGNSINFLHTTFAGAFSANPIQQFNASSVTLGRSNGTSPNILTVYGTPVFNITSNATINVVGSINTTNTGAKLAFQCGTVDTGGPIDSGGIVVFKTNIGSSDNINTRMVFYNRENTTLIERMRIADTGNILIGTTTDSGFKLDVSGSGRFSSNLTVTGSFTVVTGSTVEFQVNQTGVKIGNATTDSHSITGSVAISASAGTGSALTVYKSGSTVLDVQGSSGQLFSVTDSLTGSLFSVNTVAGLPVIEAFSDNTVNIGKYGTYPIKVVSLGTSAVISGSFSGSGADLSGIPASGIVGLNLSQIATGSVSASVSLGSGSFTITSGSSNFLFVSSSGNIGIGTTATTAKLTVNGSIAFSSYNNIIGNSTFPANAVYSAALIGATTIADGGGAGIKFTDSGGSAYAKMGFGNLNTTIGQSSFGVVPDLGARLGVRGAGTTSSTTALLVQNSSGTELLKVTDNGSTTLYGLGINSTVAVGSVNMNLSGGCIISTPTSLQVRSGITDTAVFFVNGNNATPFSYFTGNTAIGSTTDLNARLGIKGFGATSSTTALLVQNSQSTASLQLTDDGVIKFFDTNAAAVGSTYTTFIPKYSSNNMALGFYEGSSPVLRFVIYRDNSNNVYLTTSGGNAFTASPQAATLPGTLNVTSALTASSAIISGNVTVLGTASINTLIVNQTQLSTGSNQLGDAADDTQTLFGTVRIPTGSLTVTGSTNISGSSAFSGGTYLFNVAGAGDGGLRIDNTINGYNSLNWLSNTVGLGLMAGGGLFAKVSNNAGFHIGQSQNSTFVAALSVTGHGTTTSPTFVARNSAGTNILRVVDSGLVGINNAAPSASLHVVGNTILSGSAGTGSALTVYKSGSTVMSIQGSQGELFSITDSLSGSLFSVSNVSGLPILEVFSDNTVLLGSYLDPMLITTQRLTANSGSTVIYSLPTASYDGVFVDYVIRSGSNARAGQFMGMWSGSSTNVVDSSTTDFGDTSGFVLALVVSGSNMVITGSASTSAWTVRAGIRSI